MSKHFAALQPAIIEVGVHSIVNGPITYTIDGAPLVGPIPNTRNAFCIIGLRAGLGEGGGHGWLLAQQIAHGEACYDTWCIDSRRFTEHANVELTALKAVEDYQNEFRFHFPHEHRPAGRNAKTTALHAVMAAEGVEFGVVNGWERVEYFKPNAEFSEQHDFTFTEAFDVVAAEVQAVHTSVGLAEVNGFNRIEFTGEGVHDCLNSLFCGCLPRKTGRVGLGYMLNNQGNVKAEATIANLGHNTVWYGFAAASEYHDGDWLQQRLPADGLVRMTSLTDSHSILLLVGPNARAVLQQVSRDDWSAAAFPWLSVRSGFIGIAPVTVMAVSFSGELAYEIHVKQPYLVSAYESLRQAGIQHDLKLFGSRAIESMRMEKGYRHWKADLVTEFNPFETGLSRFVDMNKGFVGKPALLEMQQNGNRRILQMFTLDCDHAPAHGGASVWHQGVMVGMVTSAA